LTQEQAASVQAAMEARFPGKIVKQVPGFREAMEAINALKK
jgi:hypothetical protein